MHDWNLRGYILISKHRKNVLRSLKEKPKTVMQLSEELLAVNAITNLGEKKRNRIFVVTNNGIDLINWLNSRNI